MRQLKSWNGPGENPPTGGFLPGDQFESSAKAAWAAGQSDQPGQFESGGEAALAEAELVSAFLRVPACFKMETKRATEMYFGGSPKASHT